MTDLLQRTADLLAEWTGCDVRLDSAPLTDARIFSGECYAVYATIGDIHVEDWWEVRQAIVFEQEGRGPYAVFLARELYRRYRQRVTTPTAPAADAGAEDDADGYVSEHEMGMGEAA